MNDAQRHTLSQHFAKKHCQKTFIQFSCQMLELATPPQSQLSHESWANAPILKIPFVLLPKSAPTRHEYHESHPPSLMGTQVFVTRQGTRKSRSKKKHTKNVAATSALNICTPCPSTCSRVHAQWSPACACLSFEAHVHPHAFRQVHMYKRHTHVDKSTWQQKNRLR